MDTQLTVADIANIKTLLEAACARGAFRANEMSNIGATYDKITVFLQQAQTQTELNEPSKGETPC
jgi:hypothetical protein